MGAAAASAASAKKKSLALARLFSSFQAPIF
jgi:hypothetical protein